MHTEDIARIRELAKKVRALAEGDISQKNAKLWTAVNDLSAIRPVCHVRSIPLELLGDSPEIQPQSQDPLLRRMELNLLLRLYEWNHLRLDRVVENTLYCPAVIEDTGFGFGAPSTRPAERIWFPSAISPGTVPGKAEDYPPQIFTEADLDKIQTPKVLYDEPATAERLARVQEVVGDILPVKLYGRSDFGHNLWDELLKWMGLSEGMLNFAIEPELMHEAAERYLSAAIAQLKQYEALGLISSNNRFDNIANNGIGMTGDLPIETETGIGSALSDIWGGSADQILTCVSPAMSEEFAFEHEKQYAALFGLYSYGCCERLDNKIKQLRGAFPNLRKISMSPYSDLQKGMEAIGGDYVVCFKPNSNYLAHDTVDFDYFETELQNAFSLADRYGVNLIVNMKTIITVRGEPERLWKWCDLAADAVRRYEG